MTKRTLLLLALAATTGVPALAACSTTQSQASLPPAAVAQPYGTPVPAAPGGDVPGAPPALTAPRSGSVGSNTAPPPSSPPSGDLTTRPGYVPGMPPTIGTGRAPSGAAASGDAQSASGVAVPLAGPVPAADAASPRAVGDHIGSRAPWAALLADRAPKKPTAVSTPAPATALHAAGPSVLAPGQAKRTSDIPRASSAPRGTGPRPSLVVALTDPAAALVRLTPSSAGDRAANGAGPEADGAGHPTATASATAGAATKPASASTAPGAQPSPLPETPPRGPDAKPDDRAPAAPGTPAAKPPMRTANWTMPGFVLPAKQLPAAAATDAAPAFRHALAVSLAARPTSPRPDAGSLVRWAATLEKAAQAAPDRPTAEHLRTVSRYVSGLARVPLAGRAKAQLANYYVMATARDLRVNLPARFGIALFG